MKKSKIGFYAEKSIIGISAFVIGWLLLCVIDINIHNMTDLNYSRWNLIRYFPIERKYCGDTKQAKSLIRTPKINMKNSVKKENKKERSDHHDLMALARIIEAENGSHENKEALILTGAVVVKRTKHDNYPDTIMGVISQKGQYSTYDDGKFWNTPSKRSIKVAKMLLETSYCDSLPDNLVYQAEFRQGTAIYKKLGHEYFCLE